MADQLFILFYVAVPVVLLVAAFAYYLSERKEDIEDVGQRPAPPVEDNDQVAG